MDQLVTVIFVRHAGESLIVISFFLLHFHHFSDRYKVFIDLFNLASFLIPREFIPKLTNEMKIRLSTANVAAINQRDIDDYHPSRTKTKENENENENVLMNAESFRAVAD